MTTAADIGALAPDRPGHALPSALTSREEEIPRLIAAGWTNGVSASQHAWLSCPCA